MNHPFVNQDCDQKVHDESKYCMFRHIIQRVNFGELIYFKVTLTWRENVAVVPMLKD